MFCAYVCMIAITNANQCVLWQCLDDPVEDTINEKEESKLDKALTPEETACQSEETATPNRKTSVSYMQLENRSMLIVGKDQDFGKENEIFDTILKSG